jgi:hypothetical protein
MTDFLWSRFGKGLVKKYAFALVGGLLAMVTAPHLTSALATAGISVTTVAGVTTIVIDHQLAAAALAALVFTAVEGMRILAAKHPKVPLPPAVKNVI